MNDELGKWKQFGNLHPDSSESVNLVVCFLTRDTKESKLRKINVQEVREMTMKGTAWLSICVLAVMGFVGTAYLHASQDDEKAVGEAAAQFYVALNTLFTGDVGPMKDVWSHADDVTYMGPGGGLQMGWDQVLANWETQAAMKLGGQVKSENMHITVGRDIAVTSGYEMGENTNAEGKAQKVSIRATNVFRKEDGKWKMIGHHTDLLPYLAK